MVWNSKSSLEFVFKSGGILGLFPIKVTDNKIIYKMYSALINITTLVFQVILDYLTYSDVQILCYIIIVIDMAFAILNIYMSIFCHLLWIKLFQRLDNIYEIMKPHKKFETALTRWLIKLLPFFGYLTLQKIAYLYDAFELKGTIIMIVLRIFYLIIYSQKTSQMTLFFHEVSLYVVEKCNLTEKNIKYMISQKELKFYEREVEQIRHFFENIMKINKKLNKIFGMYFVLYYTFIFVTIIRMLNFAVTHSKLNKQLDVFAIFITFNFVVIVSVSNNLSK